MIKRKPQYFFCHSSQAGFTIIESLVAIVVVSILLAAIAPVIVLSAATRIQARRVEVATQAARAYIDGVTSGSIPSPTNTVTKDKRVADFSVPTKLDDLYCVDLDGSGGCSKDSSKDLAIQAVRTEGDVAKGYGLGLRVYRADAFKDSGALTRSDKDKKATQATFTGGIGDRKAPLVEMTTEIVTQQTTFGDFCSRLQDTSNDKSQCIPK